jgi:hypothetical protein
MTAYMLWKREWLVVIVLTKFMITFFHSTFVWLSPDQDEPHSKFSFVTIRQENEDQYTFMTIWRSVLLRMRNRLQMTDFRPWKREWFVVIVLTKFMITFFHSTFVWLSADQDEPHNKFSFITIRQGTEDQYTFMTIWRSFLLRMRNRPQMTAYRLLVLAMKDWTSVKIKLSTRYSTNYMKLHNIQSCAA